MQKNIFGNNIRYIIISAILSAVLLAAGYFVNNLPMFTGENLDQFFAIQKICEKLNISQDFDESDAYDASLGFCIYF